MLSTRLLGKEITDGCDFGTSILCSMFNSSGSVRVYLKWLSAIALMPAERVA